MIPSPPELKLTFRSDGVKSPIAERRVQWLSINSWKGLTRTDLLQVEVGGVKRPVAQLPAESRLASIKWGVNVTFRFVSLAVHKARHSHALPWLLAESVGASRVGQALSAGGAGEPGPAPALARFHAEPVVLVAAVPADRLVAELRGTDSPLLFIGNSNFSRHHDGG